MYWKYDKSQVNIDFDIKIDKMNYIIYFMIYSWVQYQLNYQTID